MPAILLILTLLPTGTLHIEEAYPMTDLATCEDIAGRAVVRASWQEAVGKEVVVMCVEGGHDVS